VKTVNPGIEAYRTLEVSSMSAARRIGLLYNVLLSGLRQAERCAAGQWAERSEGLDRARGALEELLFALDRDRGGAIATKLAAIYSWFHSELLHDAVRPDPARLRRLAVMATDLAEAWVQATALVASSAPAAVS
jgi:flagellar protein FliS